MSPERGGLSWGECGWGDIFTFQTRPSSSNSEKKERNPFFPSTKSVFRVPISGHPLFISPRLWEVTERGRGERRTPPPSFLPQNPQICSIIQSTVSPPSHFSVKTDRFLPSFFRNFSVKTHFFLKVYLGEKRRLIDWCASPLAHPLPRGPMAPYSDIGKKRDTKDHERGRPTRIYERKESGSLECFRVQFLITAFFDFKKVF